MLFSNFSITPIQSDNKIKVSSTFIDRNTDILNVGSNGRDFSYCIDLSDRRFHSYSILLYYNYYKYVNKGC